MLTRLAWNRNKAVPHIECNAGTAAGKCITPGSHYKLLLAYIFSSGYISLGDNNPGKNLPVTLNT